MDETNNKNAVQDVLRRFQEHKAESEDKTRHDWKWRDGTILFPEGRCCYCGAPVRSNRLWVVEAGWLRGQLNVESGVFEKPEHPHSGTDGGLCLGGTDNAVEALFFGVNPADPLRRDMHIGKWYEKMFGHVCGKEGGLRASELFTSVGDRYDDDGDSDGDNPCEDCCSCCERDCCSDSGIICDCGCSGCYCPPPICQICDGSIGDERTQVRSQIRGGIRNDYWRWACAACLERDYTACGRCQMRIENLALVWLGEHKYCRDCAEYFRNIRNTIPSPIARWTTMDSVTSVWGATAAPEMIAMPTVQPPEAEAAPQSTVELTPESLQAALDALRILDDND